MWACILKFVWLCIKFIEILDEQTNFLRKFPAEWKECGRVRNKTERKGKIYGDGDKNLDAFYRAEAGGRARVFRLESYRRS